jgi:glycosyltransferase involved in cell wall biosynthesis
LGFLENWVWKYLKRLYGACTVVAVPSQAVLKELQHQGIDNLIHIPHGVDTQRFSPSHRKIEWRDSIDAKNKMVVTFVGRLVWEKNLKLLADALILLKNRNQVKVVIVGEGPARNKLQEIMPDAYFTGYLGDVPLPIAYASSDIFVFPSATETFGNVTVEAMASGLPAICASVGGACDLIQNGVNGLLVSGSNPQEFANAIDLLVEQPELRKKLSHAALESISNYRWEKSIERYESIYQEILKN